MSMPFYVSPEQLMKDRADFARKGIARGRSVVVVQYADGLLFVAENQSKALHKISEIYDRIAFAAVGRYNEFENLRIAGVRHADLRGYSYDRLDVSGRGLANAYAQTLGTIFSSGGEKPYEIELFVAEVGDTAQDDQIYRLTYEGSVADEHGYAAMGGSAEQVSAYLKEMYREDLQLDDALRLTVEALGHDGPQPRTVTGDRLEVAVLDRTRRHPRKFRRLVGAHLTSLFGAADTDAHDLEAPADIPPTAEVHDGTGPAPGTGSGQGVDLSSAAASSEADSDPDDGVDDPSDALGDLPDDPPPHA